MTVRRQGDPVAPKTYYRSDRIIEEVDGFYYLTRENQKHGPFSTRSTAMFDLNNYLQLVNLRRQMSDSDNLDDLNSA